MNNLDNKIEMSTQLSLLQEAKSTKGDLPALLVKEKLTYDNLRYEEYCEFC